MDNQEILAIPIFQIIRVIFREITQDANNFTEVIKGVLERSTLLIGLLSGFPQILMLFGALKLANRIESEERPTDTGKNYFLIGNLVSIIMVFASVGIYNIVLTTQR